MSSYELSQGVKSLEKVKRLTGAKVLAILIAFFGVVAGVNGLMIYSALSTFSGEVDSHAYEHGLAYNKDLAAARAQLARGWKVDANLARQGDGAAHITVVVRNAEGAPVTGAAFAATLASPVDKKQDARGALVETSPGHYEGRLAATPGMRDLELIASQDGHEIFRSHSRRRVD